MNLVAYRYDGTLEGFLTCVFEAYEHRETPSAFLPPDGVQTSLYPLREVAADETKARRVYRALSNTPTGSPGMFAHAALSPRALCAHAFLTCLPDKELHLFAFLKLVFARGTAAMSDLTHPQVAILSKAVGHMLGEVQLLRGFVRFSDADGALVGEIEPKNRVLPLLRPHFCSRFPNERLILYDRTHKEALFYEPRRWVIAPLDDFSLGAPEGVESVYRKLWKRFYDTIAIEGRINPKLRQSHMPKRYWGTMVEMQDEGEDLHPVPPSATM